MAFNWLLCFRDEEGLFHVWNSPIKLFSMGRCRNEVNGCATIQNKKQTDDQITTTALLLGKPHRHRKLSSNMPIIVGAPCAS